MEKMPLEKWKKFVLTENLESLKKLKEELDEKYYNDAGNVSDLKYDILVDAIKSRDSNFVPTVGATLRKGDNRVELPYWLGSADKITPSESPAFERWMKKNRSDTYVVSDKLDGVSCLLHYSFANKQTTLYTRGDGIVGADISYLASSFKIPNLSNMSDFSVRGELIIYKKVFDEKYRGKTVNGRIYKNARNMVSGLIGGKTAREGLKDINFVVYEIVGDETMNKPSEQLEILKKYGFHVVPYFSEKKITLENLEEKFLERKIKSPFEIDGLVIQPDVNYTRNTKDNPDYIFAFKVLLDENIHTTTVVNIEWSASKWGQLKPVVIFEPVELDDVKISRASGHNAKYIEDNKIGVGAVIQVTRSKDVIPYIVGIVKPTTPSFPDYEWKWDDTHVNIVSNSDSCDSEICVKVISIFFKELGIKFVAEATVRKLYENGFDTLFKIIGASKKELLTVFEEKTSERIFKNIRKGLKDVAIPSVIGASCVLGQGIAKKKIEALLRDVPDLLSIYKTKSRKEMVNIIKNVDGFSDITAEKISINLKYADRFIKKLEPYATFKKEERVSSDMVGHKYVFSGIRNKELENEIKKRGGNVVDSVSKNTTAVVTNDVNSETGKVEKARGLGVKVIDIKDFKV